MNEAKLIVYIHIPKTAGTTLREIIKQQYPGGVANLEALDPAVYPAQLPPFVDRITSPESKIKWVSGHLCMEVKDYFPPSTKYVTMLRKPTEQVISHYHYIHRHPGHPLHKLVHPMTLSEFIEHPTTHWNICNPQTRQLSTTGKVNLREARKHLNRYFAVTGIVERFKESVFLMKKSFSWGDVHFENYNVNPSRPAVGSYSKEVISRIRELTELDHLLYEEALLQLEEKLEALKQQDKLELEQFMQRHP